MTLASRLKKVMEIRGLSQGRLAKEAGMPQTTIWKLIHGNQRGTKKILELAKALSVNAEWLATGEGAMEEGQPVMYEGLFPVNIYNGEEFTGRAILVPDLIKSESCRAYKLTVDSGCNEAPAGTIIVVDSQETPGNNDLVYASVNGFYQVYRFASGFLTVDDPRIPAIASGTDSKILGVVVYLLRDLRN